MLLLGAALSLGSAEGRLLASLHCPLSLTAAPCRLPSLRCADPLLLAPPADPPEFMDIWAGLVRGAPLALGPMLPPGGGGDPAEVARVEKFLKGRLVSAAEHFNRSEKKGFQYLQVGGGGPAEKG